MGGEQVQGDSWSGAYESNGLQAEGLVSGGWPLRKDFLGSWPLNEVSYLGWWRGGDGTRAVAHRANHRDEGSQALGKG